MGCGWTDAFASKLAPTVFCVVSRCCEHSQTRCGSELARESGGSVCGDVGYADAFASKPAPTGEMRSHQEPGRLLGRLVVDVDLGRPVNHAGRTQALRSGHLGMDAGVRACRA
ncbi:hypothetical protein C1C98_14810 [Pseudomonas ogarae]|uniref:DUF1534 domain-containing protein n=1 Tax=Pseudomonas ogarae (strain DSM 112162 / CECT 30235 / F113) TaxID=1114970 RepID=A0ABM6R1F7_PSEO1|nr:hypothetical protein C1C98_14810 [Pseudomonas ogarae]